MPRLHSAGARALLWAVIALALGAGWSATSAAEPAPLKVGVNLPMTGAVSAYGQMIWAGIQLAQEMRPTALGRTVQLVLVDNKSDAAEAANAMNRLVDKEGVVAVLGPATSTRALAAAAIAEQRQVPMITPTATNPTITQGRRYAFRVCFIDPFQGQVAARYAYHNLKFRKAAILTDASQDYAVALAAYFKREFQKLGGVVVVEAKCNTNDQDFSAQLGTIKATDAEILYLPNYYTEDALVARQCRELGLNLPILSGDGAQAPELLKIGGSAVEGLTFTAHFHRDAATSPTAAGFLALYDRRRQAGNLKEDLTGFHSLGADAYLALVDALNRAGSSEGPKLRQALASTQGLVGVTGALNIGPDGNAVKSVAMLRVKNGQFEFVTTIEP
ncbi:MAG: ABC transporter substrate-binding protein [Desulfarculus sp.]|nr:ABC transporter substrate-binding protein [Desulfarculus sp.]